MSAGRQSPAVTYRCGTTPGCAWQGQKHKPPTPTHILNFPFTRGTVYAKVFFLSGPSLVYFLLSSILFCLSFLLSFLSFVEPSETGFLKLQICERELKPQMRIFLERAKQTIKLSFHSYPHAVMKLCVCVLSHCLFHSCSILNSVNPGEVSEMWPATAKHLFNSQAASSDLLFEVTVAPPSTGSTNPNIFHSMTWLTLLLLPQYNEVHTRRFMQFSHWLITVCDLCLETTSWKKRHCNERKAKGKKRETRRKRKQRFYQQTTNRRDKKGQKQSNEYEE